MIAYKGFTKDLTARMGKGIFHYEFGKTYTNDEARCARTGYHCVEEPIRTLDWYSNHTDRYCVVKIGGDIHEDGCNKISATEITLVKEITRLELALEEVKWMYRHPKRAYSNRIYWEEGYADNDFVIVRGKNPKAAGRPGTTLFLVQEAKRSKKVIGIGIYEVDGKDIVPDIYYDIDGKEVPEDDAEE